MRALPILILLIQVSAFSAYMKFTNVKCVAYDKPFADFRYCKLKALSRNTVALSLYVQLFQVPVNNVSVNVDVYKRANGFRPFLFNITGDFCNFLRHKKRLPFGKLLLDAVQLHSNINHTCPYDHDIIIKDMILRTEHLQLLPVPTGDYMLKISFGAYNEYKATIRSYIQVVEN